MKINAQHIAKLANLPITPAEEKKFTKQLEAILEHIEKLSEVQTEHVEETSQITGLTNTKRSDKQSASLTQEEAVGQAKEQHNEMFSVPVLIEEAVE